MHTFTRLAAATVLVVGAANASAQLPLIPTVRLGVEAGANFAKVDGTGTTDISNRTGTLAGVTLAVHLLDSWSIQTGALYSMKGWNHTDPTTQDQDNAHINYIEIPALLKYEFRNPSPVTPFLLGGAGFSVQQSCSVVSTPGGTTTTSSTSCETVKTLTSGAFAFNSFDIGAIGGGGVSLQLGAPMLSVAARYEYGLKDVTNSGDPKSRVVTLSAGLSWPVPF